MLFMKLQHPAALRACAASDGGAIPASQLPAGLQAQLAGAEFVPETASRRSTPQQP
jgi:hypothetical protein